MHGEPLAPWLESIPLPRAVLFPCSDSMTRAVAGLPSGLRERFPSTVPPEEILDRVVDKGPFAESLQRARVPHPFTRPMDRVEDLEGVPDAVFESAFLKPRNSQAFFARFQVKGFMVRSRTEAATRLSTLMAAGFAMVLQEYVPGGPDAHYFVDGYVDRTGAVRAVFVRRRLRMFPRDFGNSSYMVSIAAAEAAGAVDNVRRLLTTLDYRGIFSVELKHDPRDDQYKVIELNARPWWYVDFAARCGVDVCSLMYRDSLGLPVGDVPGYRTGQTLMYPPYDFSAVRPFGRDGHPSFARWCWQALRADQPVWRWSDPGPGLYEGLEWVLPALGIRFGGSR